MGKGLQTGKTFLAGVRSKITDPERLAAFDKLYADESFLTEVGNGVEGQSELDRLARELTTQRTELETKQQEIDQREAGLTSWHQDLTTWHQTQKDALEEAKRLKAGGNPNPNPAPQPPAGLTLDALDEKLAQERAAFLGYDRDKQSVMKSHFEKFKELIDLDPILRHPQIGTLGLVGTYELLYKDRLTQHKTDADKAAEERIRLDERQKVQAAQASMPYPTPTGVGSGSPLDALTGQKDTVLDAATQHYNRLQAERIGAGA